MLNLDEKLCEEISDYFSKNNQINTEYSEDDCIDILLYALKKLEETNESQHETKKRRAQFRLYLNVIAAISAYITNANKTLVKLNDTHEGIPWGHLAKICHLMSPNDEPTQGIAGKFFIPQRLEKIDDLHDLIEHLGMIPDVKELIGALTRIKNDVNFRQTDMIGLSFRIIVDARTRKELLQLSQNVKAMLRLFEEDSLAVFALDVKTKRMTLLRIFQQMGEIIVNLPLVDRNIGVFPILKELRNVLSHPENPENFALIEGILNDNAFIYKGDAYDLDALISNTLSAIDTLVNTEFKGDPEEYVRTLQEAIAQARLEAQKEKEKLDAASTKTPKTSAPKSSLSQYEQTYQKLTHTITAYQNELPKLLEVMDKINLEQQKMLKGKTASSYQGQDKLSLYHCLREYYQIRLGSYARSLLDNPLIGPRLPPELKALKTARGFLAHGGLRHIGRGKSATRDSAVVFGEIVKFSEKILPLLLTEKNVVDFIFSLKTETFLEAGHFYSLDALFAKTKTCLDMLIHPHLKTPEEKRLVLEHFLKLIQHIKTAYPDFNISAAPFFFDMFKQIELIMPPLAAIKACKGDKALEAQKIAQANLQFEGFLNQILDTGALQVLFTAFENANFEGLDALTNLKAFVDFHLWEKTKNELNQALKDLTRYKFQGRQTLENIFKSEQNLLGKLETAALKEKLSNLMVNARYVFDNYYTLEPSALASLLEQWQKSGFENLKLMKDIRKYFDKISDFLSHQDGEDKTEAAQFCLDILHSNKIPLGHLELTHELTRLEELVTPLAAGLSLNEQRRADIKSFWSSFAIKTFFILERENLGLAHNQATLFSQASIEGHEAHSENPPLPNPLPQGERG